MKELLSIIIESSVEDQFLIAENNSPRTSAAQFLTNKLGENFNVSFENVQLQTVTLNFTKIVKKKKRVATGAKVTISEETKIRLFPDKNKENTIFCVKKMIT